MYNVLKYIHKNISMPLNAAEVAHYFGYSRNYFSEKFREFTGRTFVEYVRHYRMQLAAVDILNGKKVSDVALDFGYDSVGGFSKAFLGVYGCQPREYCKRARESQLYYERRKLSMYQLSDRCAMLRDEILNKRTYISRYSAQRNIYHVIGLAEAREAGWDNHKVNAHGMAVVLDKFTPVIVPGELIVGFNYGYDFRDGTENMHFEPENDDERGREIMKRNNVSDEDAARYFAVRKHTYEDSWHLWFPEGNPRHGKAAGLPVVELTEEEQNGIKEWASLGGCTFESHSLIGYEQVVKLGFEGLLEKVEYYEKKNGTNSLYEGMKDICKSAFKLGEKYAAEARRLLETKDPDYEEADLLRIIEACSQVPRKPARTFHEAVQAVWFAHVLNTFEDRVNANSLGHLDWILYPYYKADIEKGLITKEQAFELICCLWLKIYSDHDVQQSCVGGTYPDGSDAVNDLSYMMLDATEQIGLIRCLAVRFSKKTDRAFIRRALEVVGHVQKGVPFFFNDDVLIPALVEEAGIPYEDATTYAMLGCVETTIPGKSNPHAITAQSNFCKAIEYLMCRGYSMMNPELKVGLDTGDLSEFTTYEKFLDGVKKQIEHMLDLCCSIVKKNREASVFFARPFKSLLTEGCMETGYDFNNGGALYDYYQIAFGAVPNLADSLMVVKKFVYDEKKYTLAELKEILQQNYPDESVRQEFINKAPKFGNDIDEVDQIAVDILNFGCDVLKKLSVKYDMSFHAQPFTFFYMIDYGNVSAASPDGRRKGETFAYSMSPMQGRDFNGLTAVFNSLAKLPGKRTPGTTSAIIEIDPKLFTDQNIDVLTDIFIASGHKGLCNVQFNNIDVETLLEAKKYPEKYNNLAVRVSGFSQKFNLLRPEVQDHIIARTKHKCL